MRIIIIIFLFLITTIVSAQKVIDKVVGIVDDRIILLSDVEAQYQQYAYQSTLPVPADFKCEILNQFLIEKLLIAQAVIDSVTVSDDEVENELDHRVRSFSGMAGSVEKLEEYYGKSILEIKDEFRIQIREQLIANKEKGNIITNIKVTPSDVQQFFNSIPTDSLPYYNAEEELGALIIYPKVSIEMKEYSYKRAEDLLTRIKNGEDFSALASAYSEDPGSADKGGELGFVNRGELDPAFEAAAFSLKNPNDISNIIESAFGFHIMQLIERRGDRINVRHILIKPKTTSYDLTNAGKLADSAYYLIQSGKSSFAEAVSKFSEDEGSKNNGGMIINPASQTSAFNISDLGTYDQSLVTATDTLQVGAVSKPTIFHDKQGKTGFRLIYLKSKSRPHQANLRDDYDKISGLTLAKKQDEAVNSWLKDRISKSYILIEPEFQTCKVLDKWTYNTQQ
ncbi:MAG: peptidylprolyl isomerase [Chitinophagales bacterium]|nr:peptidylprolyl isomerase [Chitinophagales bacterium]